MYLVEVIMPLSETTSNEAIDVRKRDFFIPLVAK